MFLPLLMTLLILILIVAASLFFILDLIVALVLIIFMFPPSPCLLPPNLYSITLHRYKSTVTSLRRYHKVSQRMQ